MIWVTWEYGIREGAILFRSLTFASSPRSSVVFILVPVMVLALVVERVFQVVHLTLPRGQPRRDGDPNRGSRKGGEAREKGSGGWKEGI